MRDGTRSSDAGGVPPVAAGVLGLGASWVHGTIGNPITGLAEQAAATLASTSYDSAIAYDASGRKLGRAGDAAIACTTNEVFDTLAVAQDADADRSVGSAIHCATRRPDPELNR